MGGSAWAVAGTQITTVLFAIFATGAAGIAAGLGWSQLMGRQKHSDVPAVLCVALAMAAIVCLLVRFQRIERFFNAFAHLSSPMTQVLVVVILIAVAVIVGLVIEKRSERQSRAVAVVLIILAAAMAVIQGRFLGSSGQLVADMAAGSVLTAGLIAMVAACVFECSTAETVEKAPRILLALGAVATAVGGAVLFLLHSGSESNNLGTYMNPITFTSGNSQATSFMDVATGDLSALLFVGAALILAAVVVAVIALVSKKRAAIPWAPIVSSALAFIGGIPLEIVYLTAISMSKISVFG